MKISLCMITKGDSELESLQNCLDSVAQHVDGVYITATSDETSRLSKYTKKMGYNLSFFKWCDDFSAARNFNFSQAPKDTDYILWLDSDDLFVGAEMLRGVAEECLYNGKTSIFFEYWYGCTFRGIASLETMVKIDFKHNRERLVKPSSFKWKGRLHETPVPIEGAKNDYTVIPYEEARPIAVMHTAQDVTLPEKQERNKRILELQLAEERNTKDGADPRTLLYLMKIYAEMPEPELWKKCIEMGGEYLQKSGWDEERGTCWEQMGICYGRLGNKESATDCFREAIREWPHQPLFYVRLASSLYNEGKYRQVDHYLQMVEHMDLDQKGSGMTNFNALKAMYADLVSRMELHVKKNVAKALQAAKLLYNEDPNPQNREFGIYLENLNDLNNACRDFDNLAQYLESIGEGEGVLKIMGELPRAITSQPFAIKIAQRLTPPRVWGDREICYFASFGGKHFEEWSPKSLETGIGGSETAVIQLAKEWTKLGYQVTVYGDPGNERGLHDGVLYLPYYEFNKNDHFNIFIQWRSPSLAGKIKAKKFIVDLHDVFSGIDYTPEVLQHIYKVMVKSEYHRNLAPNIPDDKVLIISNGI